MSPVVKTMVLERRQVPVVAVAADPPVSEEKKRRSRHTKWRRNQKKKIEESPNDSGVASGSSSSTEVNNKKNDSPGRFRSRQKKKRVRNTQSLKNTTEDKKTSGVPEEERKLEPRSNRVGAGDISAKEFVPKHDVISTGEKKCWRCNKCLFKSRNGLYLTQEHCRCDQGNLHGQSSSGNEETDKKSNGPRRLKSRQMKKRVRNTQSLKQITEETKTSGVPKDDGISTEEKKCTRCKKGLFKSRNGLYLTEEHCRCDQGNLHGQSSSGNEETDKKSNGPRRLKSRQMKKRVRNTQSLKQTTEDTKTSGVPEEESRLEPRTNILGAWDISAKEFVPKNDVISADEKKCWRCNKCLFKSRNGLYLTLEHCRCDQGNLQRPPGGLERMYSCCKGREGTQGCTTAELHTWREADPERFDDPRTTSGSSDEDSMTSDDPVESDVNSGSELDINATEFVPTCVKITVGEPYRARSNGCSIIYINGVYLTQQICSYHRDALYSSIPLGLDWMHTFCKAHLTTEGCRAVELYASSEAESEENDEAPLHDVDRKPVVASVNKTVKKKQHSDKWSPGSKQNYSHEWLLDANNAILNMEFSANGKFLATCTDDDPGGTSGSSSSSEANKENSSPGRLTRRQKKNRIRKEDTSPLKKKAKMREIKKKGKHDEACPLRQYTKLNLNDTEVYRTLRNYTLSPEDMMSLGYPVESKLYPGRAMIYRAGALDANAKEFVPRDESVYTSLLCQNSDQFSKRQELQIKRKNTYVTEEKKCMRCNKGFFMSSDGEYLTQESCTYHWGKLHTPQSGGIEWFYTCCKAKQGTKGCTTAKLHVWTGVEPGRNGPFDGYVRTRQRKTPPQDGNYGVYSLDCEMCFTNTGLELTKISVVSLDGKPVYETFVRPESFIIDYNTRFSGITAKDMSRNSKVKNLKDVQNDLMGFITADTILVGHGLENDLRALKMIHYAVVDSAIMFPHILGLPYKRSLKSLTHSYLRKDIQVGAHDSYEDACSCMELILWKLRKDLYNDK